jgi:hypothetical protein
LDVCPQLVGGAFAVLILKVFITIVYKKILDNLIHEAAMFFGQ